MGKRFAEEELYHIRNNISIYRLIIALSIPFKVEEEIFRFLCPLCNNGHTATNPKNNLARCFDCQKNFNTIDLTMLVRKTGFVDSVKALMQFDSTGKMP